MEQIGPVNYRVRRSNRTNPIIVHVDKLKPYIAEADNVPICIGTRNRNSNESLMAAAETNENNLNGIDNSVQPSSDDSPPSMGLFHRPCRQHKLPARFRE
jgi:hypothetical protein